MRSRVLGAATFFLSLQLLAAASAHAQGPQPPTPPKVRPPFSGVAHNVVTWFHHVTGTGAHRHQIVSSRLYLDRGRRNLQRRRRNYRLQRLSRIRRRWLSRMRRNLRPPPLSRIRCLQRPMPVLSRISRRRLS